MNYNKVQIAGNLTRDPELKSTPQGSLVCNFSLAVNRTYKVGEEIKKETDFFTVITWGKSAENCAKYLFNGSSAFVEGRLKNRSWEKNGVKRTVTEIIAENVIFLSRPKDRPEPIKEPDYDPERQEVPDDGGVPF